MFKWKKIELGPNIGYLPQNIELFGGSLMDNVSRFNPINDKFLQQACELAGIRELYDSHKAGKVISIEKDLIVVDIGLKSEGRISKKEFGSEEETSKIKSGDDVEVYIERLEDINGNTILSREKARREEAWVLLEKSHKAEEIVTGIILGRVKLSLIHI